MILIELLSAYTIMFLISCCKKICHMARSTAVACAETPSHSHGPGNIRVRVSVSFTTEAVRSAILASAGLLVNVHNSIILFYIYALSQN